MHFTYICPRLFFPKRWPDSQSRIFCFLNNCGSCWALVKTAFGSGFPFAMFLAAVTRKHNLEYTWKKCILHFAKCRLLQWCTRELISGGHEFMNETKTERKW